MFNEQKTAQIAGWFLAQAAGTMAHLKLMKLMYLADRESMRRNSFPMTGDHFVSMPHGPVLSLTLSHMNDEAPSTPGGWDDWISDKADYVVGLRKPHVDPDDFDELSRTDLAVLSDVWKQFGEMGKYEIRDYTHNPRNCPEWKNPNGSSRPIGYEDVFVALGYDQDAANHLALRIRQQSKVSRSIAA